MTCGFLGTSAGSRLGVRAYTHWGRGAVCALIALIAPAALAAFAAWSAGRGGTDPPSPAGASAQGREN